MNHRSDASDDARETIDSTRRLQSIFKNGSETQINLPTSLFGVEYHGDDRHEVDNSESYGGFLQREIVLQESGSSHDRLVPSPAFFKAYPARLSSFIHNIRHGARDSDRTDEQGSESKKRGFLDMHPLSSADDTSRTELVSDLDFNVADMSNLGNRVSLDSSVLEVMARGEGLDLRKGKFPFLAQYELIKRKKLAMDSSLDRTQNTNAKDAELVFALSGLDDYNQYLRSAKLDQEIAEKVKQRHIPGEENVLKIVDHAHLAENYASRDADNFDEKHESKMPRAKLPWAKITDERNIAAPSVISTLRRAADTSSSSDSNQSGVFLHRKLKVRHLQMISFGGTLGVGLYLNSGKAIAISGGLGTILAFLIVGIIVLASISSFSEMVTFFSVVDGVSGLCSRFVDESFGFAAGWVYFISFSVGLAAEIVASAIILSYFKETKVLVNTGSTIGFVALCLLFCVISNMITVQMLGEIEYLASFFKIIATLIFIIVMIIINRGGMGEMGTLGFKYWQYLKSDFEHNIIYGPMRPTFDLRSNGISPTTQGIGGNLGRFLSLLAAILIVTYAYSGTEIVCIAACEAKEPRKALPKATKRVFWRILLFYCLASFVVSLNIYAGDPRLLRYYVGSTVSPQDLENNYAFQYLGGKQCRNNYTLFAGFGNGSQSPWAVAFQTAGLCNWSSVVNGVLFVFALSCGNSQLYASSRTIYSMALQRKAPRFLTKCNRHGIPYYAVLVASCPALSAFICVSEKATVVFQNLTSLISSAGVLVWFSMCLAYLRFFYGLKKRPDIISREDKAYPYRSPFQPYLAMIGVFGLLFITFSNGFVVFLLGFWNTLFFFASYGALILFALLFCGHRLIKGSSMLSLEALDYDSGKRETDIFIWDGGREHNPVKLRDIPHKVFDFVA